MITTRITEKNVDGVLTNLKTTDERVRAALGVGLARGLLFAVGIAQVKYMRDETPLGERAKHLRVRSGQLSKFVSSEVVVSNNEITGRIGDVMPYAAYHEFGFHGVIKIGSHSRVTSLEISNGTVRIVHEGGSKKMARKLKRNDRVGVTFVSAHDRRVNYAGRPYLRPALDEAKIPDVINEELKKLSNV